MVTVADPDVVIVPMTLPMIGVMARHVYVTRTDIRLPAPAVPQDELVPAPDGGVPVLSTQLR